MSINKVVVAVSLEDNLIEVLKKVKDVHLDPQFEIHLVHVFPVILYARGMQLSVLTYPTESEKPEIEKHVMEKMTMIEKEIFSKHKNVIKKCLFGSNEKATFNEYVENAKAEMVVVATRKKHHNYNFFDSSFAQHQLKYSPAYVLVLR